MNLEALVRLAASSPLTEIYVPGYYDDGGARVRLAGVERGQVFHPLYDNVYLEFGHELAHLRTMDQYSRLGVALANEIACPFQIDPEEGLDGFGVAPLLRCALQSGRDAVRVARIDAYVSAPSNGANGLLCGLGMTCDSGDYLFFDPLDINGIHVGAAGARDLWVSYWGSHPDFPFHVESYDVAAAATLG